MLNVIQKHVGVSLAVTFCREREMTDKLISICYCRYRPEAGASSLNNFRNAGTRDAKQKNTLISEAAWTCELVANFKSLTMKEIVTRNRRNRHMIIYICFYKIWGLIVWKKILVVLNYSVFMFYNSKNFSRIFRGKLLFYILLTVNLDMTSGRWPTWRTILLYNTFISFLYMFRANTCSSSEGQLY